MEVPGIANENRNSLNIDTNNESPEEYIPSLAEFQRSRAPQMPPMIPTIVTRSGGIPSMNMHHPHLPQMPGLPGFIPPHSLNMNMSNMSPKKDANATPSASSAVPPVLPIPPLVKEQRSKPSVPSKMTIPPLPGYHPPHLPVFRGVNPPHIRPGAGLHHQFLRPIPPQIPPVFRNEKPRYNPYSHIKPIMTGQSGKTDKTKETKSSSSTGPTLDSISRDAQNSFIKNARQSLAFLQHDDVQNVSNALQQKLTQLRKTQHIQSTTNMNLNVGHNHSNVNDLSFAKLAASARSISTPYCSPGSPSLRKIDENGMMATTPKEAGNGKCNNFMLENEQKTPFNEQQEGKKDVDQDEEQKANLDGKQDLNVKVDLNMNMNMNMNHNVTPSQQPIMSVVGGRVFVIPTIEEIVKNTDLLKPRETRKEQGFRGYSVGGFSLRNDTKRRQMANMALKRSRTTFEPRSRSKTQRKGLNGFGMRNLQKLGIGKNESNSKTVKAKTAKSSFNLLKMNDDLMKDPHVRSHVRKMLKGINLARRRSLSCGALMAVQE